MTKQARECPNCGRPAMKDGNQIACEHCDAIFEIKPTGARVKEVGRFDDLERRVRALEGKGKPDTAPDGQPTDGKGGTDAAPSGTDEGNGEKIDVTFEDE